MYNMMLVRHLVVCNHKGESNGPAENGGGIGRLHYKAALGQIFDAIY